MSLEQILIKTYSASRFFLMGLYLLTFDCLLSDRVDHTGIIALRMPCIPEVPSPAMFALPLRQKCIVTINSEVLNTDFFSVFLHTSVILNKSVCRVHTQFFCPSS